MEFERWLSLPEVVLLPEPTGLHELLRHYASNLQLGQASWTDAYLAAFARAGSFRMVTFDGGLARYTDLDLLHLKL